MNHTEYMLNKLSQECIEVAKEISKALEFGLEDVYDPNKTHNKSNKQKIESELNDLFGVLDMIVDQNILDINKIACSNGREKKVIKVEKYMEYSRKTGALQ